MLAVLAFSAVLIWLDATILGMALERLADPVSGLGASPAELQWAVGSYSLLFATVLFIAGALGDRYGHRTILVLGLLAFGVASAWAAWSSGPTQLVVARGLMGAGGAMIMPASMSIIGSVFPPERRAGAIAAWSASAGVGVAAGPLLGGVLIDHFWWGSVFLVNVPAVALVLVCVAVLLPNPRSPQRRRPDPAGLLLSTVGLLALAYGLIEGGQDTDWTRWRVWGSIIAGVAILACFVAVELRAAQPSFDPRLFRVPRFAAGNAALAAMFFAITGQMFYGTFYLQGARHMSALDAGLAGLPNALGVIAGSPLGTRLVRRFGIAPVSGTALTVLAGTVAAMVGFDVDTPLVWFLLDTAVAGVAIGAVVAPVTAAVLAELPMERMGAGSAVSNTLRQVGNVLGAAVLGTVLSTTYRHGIGPHLAGLPAAARSAAGTSAEATRHAAAAAGRPDLVSTADSVFVHAMHVAAVWGAMVALLGAVVLVAAFRRRASSAATAPVVAEQPQATVTRG
ncbi:MAG: MFS transporter [Micromonosporaceae bacterium]|jgi:EmrB/QacA subfamily drug resistance transporter|nr:MFS transporter [Micromonosporaceae bacterium]